MVYGGQMDLFGMVILRRRDMTVDLSELEAGDTIELRDGTKHEVTLSLCYDGRYFVETQTERIDEYDSNKSWIHHQNGELFGYPEAMGGIVTIYKKPKKEIEMYDEKMNGLHYKKTSIEPIDVIQEWKLGFCLGNLLKYVARAGIKTPNKLEDLRKALWYLQREIKELEDEQNDSSDISNKSME
jgi:hypothetical protein